MVKIVLGNTRRNVFLGQKMGYVKIKKNVKNVYTQNSAGMNKKVVNADIIVSSGIGITKLMLTGM